MDEIIYTDSKGNYLTEKPFAGNKYSYTAFDKDDNVLNTWIADIDAGDLIMREFKISDIYKKFLEAIDERSEPVVAAPEPTHKTYSKPSPSSQFWGNNTGYNYHYEPPKAKTGYVEKYNNSDTLVFHLNDPSTVMLKQIYEGKGYDVITDNNIDKNEIHQLMESHQKIICLGHGTSAGLIGGNITPAEGKYFEGKNLFIIWCNAADYFDRYCPSAKGQFITGNMPSEVWECSAAGCGAISKELMLENITYWSKLCADSLERCLSGDVKGAVEWIRNEYIKKYGDHPVTIYNAERTRVHGTSMAQNIAEVQAIEKKYGFDTPDHIERPAYTPASYYKGSTTYRDRNGMTYIQGSLFDDE